MSEKVIKKISDLKKELHDLRIDNSMGRLKDVNKIRAKRKEVARSFTELNQPKKVEEKTK